MDQSHDADHDQALLGAWERGDERGFTDLVVRYFPLIYARCRRALGAGDADDATQAVFLVLARKRAQAAASPVLAAWLLTVAENVIRNARRDLARRRRAESAAPLPEPTDEVNMRDIKDHLDAALADLPADERTAVQLHLLAGHTLAEVATHVGSPLRTVHARVQRGLDRLRTVLGSRGVAVGTLALVAVLQAEAATQVPATMMIRLRDLTAAGGGGGAISAVSARARRWSRQGPSLMSSIIVTVSAFFLVGAVVLVPWHQPVESAPPSPSQDPSQAVHEREPIVVPPVAPAPLDDPTRARWWYVVTLNDGARTVARLQDLPEMVFLPTEMRESLLGGIGSVRSAMVAFDLLSVMPAHERGHFVRSSTASATNTFPVDHDAADAAIKHLQDIIEGKRLPSMQGWVEADHEQAPALLTIRSLLDGGSIAGLPVSSSAAGWTIHARDNSAQVVTRAARVEWSAESGLTEGAPLPPEDLMRSRDGTADVEIRLLDDRGAGAQHVREDMAITVAIADDGMRLTMRSQDRSLVGEVPAGAMPVVDRARLSRLPDDAIAGMVLALSPATTKSSAMMNGFRVEVVRQTNPNAVDAADNTKSMDQITLSVLDALADVDGHLRCWIQPGSPVPTMSFVVDLPEAAARSLLASIGTPGTDGTVFVAGATFGWADGMLKGTTHPGGLSAVVESGGFTKHDEVQRALAAMTPDPVSFCVIMRPEPLVTQILPFAAMFMPVEQQQQLTAYQRRLAQTKAFGYLTLASSPTGMQVDAGGLLAFIAGVMIGNLLAEPEMLLRAIN